MQPRDTIVVDRHIALIAKQRMRRNVRLAESSRAPALWCTATYDLLGLLVHLHCDVMIGT